MAKVNIFVSSTCYDLSQIRNDLRQCIQDLGHNPILSELKDFPIDTRLSNAENCINAVNKEADIFVLIIGNKYGSVLESGKSITNVEFLAAINKGIPIYTFALKQMTNILPVWEKNPNADYSHIVDNNKVFEFLADVRKKRGLWNFEFENAQDITEILKAQLSNLFHDALGVKRMIEQSDYQSLFQKISSRASNILIRKEDDFYEIKFFFQSMIDELEKYHDLKNDYDYSILLKPSNMIDDYEHLLNWLQIKLSHLKNYTDSINRLLATLDKYLAELGVPSDLEGLYYVSRSYAKAYASLIEWGIEIKSTIVPIEYQNLLFAFADIPADIIRQMENYPIESLKIVKDSEVKYKAGELEEGSVVSLTLHITINDEVMQRYSRELESVSKKAFRSLS